MERRQGRISGAASLGTDEKGSVAILLAVVIALVIGFVGLAVDLGQVFTANTEHQSHADAAVIAGASQLDGNFDAIDRATAAIQNNLIRNRQTADGGTDVAIVSIRFLSSLPADDEPITEGYYTEVPALAECVQVTTVQTDVNSTFISAVGGPNASGVNARSIACSSQVICDIPPMAFCNPIPPGGDPCSAEVNLIAGQQIRAKFQGPGANWTPGGMGYIDPPDPYNKGATNIAKNLAGAFSSIGCIEDNVDIDPGQVASAMRGMNVRMDLYQQPFATGWKNGPDAIYFRPARNVTKGYVPDGGGPCNVIPDPILPPLPPTAMGFPRDSNIVADPTERFGNSIWNRMDYWALNHPGVTMPFELANASRYAFYRYENKNEMIPNNSATGGEDGNPQCSNASDETTDIPDRRMMIMAVINCACGDPINGSAQDVPIVDFIKTFMTEPVTDPGDGMEYMFEFIDVVEAGGDDGVLHNIVQIYR